MNQEILKMPKSHNNRNRYNDRNWVNKPEIKGINCTLRFVTFFIISPLFCNLFILNHTDLVFANPNHMISMDVTFSNYA